MTRVEQKQAQKRREILMALLPVLEKKTVDELSVKDICDIAGISIGSFYHYFENKSDVLVALFTRTDTYMEEVAFPKMTSDDELENIRIFATCWLEYNESDGPERSKMISSIGVTDSSIGGGTRTPIKKLTEQIARGQKKGLIEDSLTPEMTATLFMIALRGIGLDWTRRGGTYSLTGYGKDYIDMLLKALKKQA